MNQLKKPLCSVLSILLASGPAFAAGTRGLPPGSKGPEAPGSKPVIPSLPSLGSLELDPLAAGLATGLPAPAAAALLQGFPAAAPAGVKVLPEPVAVEIPEKELEKLEPARRADAEFLAGFLQERLFTWKEVALELPGTVFDGEGKPVIGVGDLFKAPTSDEVREIGTSDGGQGPRLTPAQREEVRLTSRFSVPSRRYPGQTHVWQLARWLQKGREAIVATRRAHQARAAEQVLVNLPNRVTGASAPSLRRAAVNLGEGLYETVSLLVGLPASRPARPPAAVEGAVREALFARLEETAGREGRSAALYDDKLWKKAEPLIREAADKASSAEPGNKDAALEKALVESKELEALAPGLGRLVADQAKAARIVAAAEESVDRDTGARAEEVRARLEGEHPVLSLIPAWLDPRVADAAAAYKADRLALLYPAVEAQLRREGLGAQASALAAELDFRRSAGPALRSKLSSETAPKRSFVHSWRIWRASRWVREARRTPEGEVYYTPVKHKTLTTDTQDPVWRILNGLARTATWWNNALFHILVSNLWDGPLGFKSLFFYSPFKPDWTMDPKTGEVSRSGETGTMLSRVRASWASRREILADFEKDQDYGFLGKDVRRFFMVFTVDIPRGFLAPAFILLGQPVLTALNLAFAALALATSMLWAPAAALLNWAFNAAIHDLDRGAQYPPFLARWLPPLLDRVAGQLALGTVLQGAISLLGIPFHLLVAAVIEGFGLLRTGLRRFWDFLMRGIVNWRGRVPPRDYRLFIRRVAGPGLTADHFFQVPSDLVLVALQAGLEREALSLYKDEASQVIRLPSESYAKVLRAFELVAGRGGDGRTAASSTIAEREREHLKALEKAAKPRETLHGRLLSVPGRETIKLAQKDFEPALKKSVVLTRKFHEALFSSQGWDEARVARFWKASGLEAGDWEGLARSHLGRVFGSAFLLPLEETDKTFKIEVAAPDLADYAAGLESGILPEDLAEVILKGTRPEPKPVEPPAPGLADYLRSRTLVDAWASVWGLE